LSAAPAGPPAGLFDLSIQGRHAPALFVTGWLATLVGLGATVVGLLSGAGAGAVSTVLLTAGLAILSVGLVLLGGSQTIERTAAGRAYGGPSPVLVFAAVLVVTLLAAILVGVPLELAGVHLDRAVGDLISVGLQALVFIGVVRVMVVGPGAISWADMGFGVPVRRVVRALLEGASIAVPVVAVTLLLAGLLVLVFGNAPPSPLPPTGTTTGLILHLLAGAVVAPIAEEIVFRGVAVTAWSRTNGAWTAIVRAAVLFAVAHVLLIGGQSFGDAASLAIVGAAARLPVALALGWIYLRQGSIWSAIGLHATFNAILILLAERAISGG
jgi:membrane protease YdiL (CAAX protease family)